MSDDGALASLQRVLGDAYTLEGELGRGGMGVVYRAHDNRHDRAVAIKVLREEIATSFGAARFNQEIRIESRLQHPNIVPIHEWAQRENTVFSVMPLIAGESLRHRLARENQLPIRDAIRIAREIAGALAYAHEQGIVHRDVKPENILLSSGHAMLTDFGIARILGDVAAERWTETGLAIGTVAYMSPEQGAGDADVGPASDIYSLGCVLYEMLAGAPPFGSDAPRAVLARHLRDAPPPMDTVRPLVPDRLLDALDRSLAKVPADRYATAQEFAHALELSLTPTSERALRGSSGGMVPIEAVVARRRMWGAAVGVTVLGIAGALWFRARTPLDDNRVVVFPLQSVADGAADVSRGWDVAIAIGASLEHADPLRVIDGYSHLSAEMRTNPRLLSASGARRLARERGARHYIDGVIARRGDSTEVVLRLHDAQGDSLVAQESAVAGVTVSAPTLGLRAITRLLPRLLDPTRHIDAGDLAERSPSAVALWIQGEREYRQSRFAPALELFRRAVREDSALAIAAVRGAQAASWESKLEEAEGFAELAIAAQRNLPTRYRDFAIGLKHYLQGDADSARIALERSLVSNAEGAEPAMVLGEVYVHLLGGPAAPPDSAAEHWLGEAVRRDSAFTPPLFHLAEIALRRGDVSTGKRITNTLRERGASPPLVRQLQLMTACVDGGRPEWTRMAGVDPDAVLAAGKELLSHFAQPACAEDALRALLRDTHTAANVRWSALLHLQGLLVATRRTVELRALLDSTVAAGTSGARALYILDAVAGTDRTLMQPKADEAAGFAQAAYGPAYERASPQTRWVLGLWHAMLGDTARLRAMSVVSDSVARTSGRRQQLFAKAMHAHLQLALGDTTAAITELSALRPSARRDSLTYELFEPLAVERALLMVLQLDRGANDAALRTASLLESPQPAIYLPFLPLSLDVRARASEKLDRRRDAEQYRSRLRQFSSASPQAR